MNTQSFKERHAAAMLSPEGEEETIVVGLYTQLTRVADRWSKDRYVIPAIEAIGSAIIRINSTGQVGRLDQGTLDKQVRDVVERAGGSTDEF